MRNYTPEALEKIEWYLKAQRIEYTKEYQFAPPRKFRFDIYLPKYKVGIEYEGIYDASFDPQEYNSLRKAGVPSHMLPTAKKSRHTNIKGYNNDCIKYNLAQLTGYKVLRYTAGTYKNFFDDIKLLVD